MEETSINHVVPTASEKKMDKIQSSALGDGKGHDVEKRKEHKHSVKDSSHSEKHREHKSHSESHRGSSDSKKLHDSNSKPKENSHSSGNKNKENSSFSKPKDGLNNSISKVKDPVSKSSDSKSSPNKDSSSKPKHSSSVKSGQGDQLSKTKVPGANLNHSATLSRENNVNSTPREHGSSGKHKDSSGKPKENSVSKPKENSSSHKHKELSSSKPKENSSNGKPKDVSLSKPKENSVKPKEGSNNISKHSDPSSRHSTSSKPKENGEKSSGLSSSKPKSSSDKISSSSSGKSKDGSSKHSIKPGEKSDKLNNSSAHVKVKTEKLEGDKSDKLNHSSNQVKVKTERSEGEKKHQHSKESHVKKEDKPRESSSMHKLKDSKPVQKIKQEPIDKAGDSHNFSISYKSSSNLNVQSELLSDEDVPLSAKKAELIRQERNNHVKREAKTEKRYREASDSEDEPLSARIENAKKLKKEQNQSRKRKADDSDDELAFKKSKKAAQNKKLQNQTSSPTKSPTKKKKEEEQEVWKWWEEEKLDEGVKWKTLEHKGPVFAPDYEPLPKSVKFLYDGKHMELSPEAEEVATFYSKLLDHDYTSKEAFNKNFFKDWRKVMAPEEKAKITDLKLCNFKQMQQYFLQKTEERKAMTKDEKLVIKKENEELQKEYGFCIIDGHKEKIGNFKIEPPGLFRGRGEHPKMGMLKKRTMPEEVIINCSKGSKVPPPPSGHKWKEVRHDNTVTWLACWTENIQGSNKYIMLNPSSKLKGEKDMQKYEVARKLKNCVDTIRDNYRKDWKSKEMRIRQRAVALYFIDKLALRAGNEKEEGETADTVGCCSLRFEHITLDEEKDGQEFVVNFDFLGKDSIRYVNSVAVEKRVFKNLQLFMENKQTGDDLFDRLNTATLNKHLGELMDGLTAKVFRTYNASKTLQEQLDKLTNPDDPIPAKMLSYNRANRAVAILCNHQRAVPKTFDKSMENLQTKIQAKQEQIKEAKTEVKDAKKSKDKSLTQKKEKALERLKDQLIKLELMATDKEENKQIALGTSKLNYLDPRITVAWCKKWEVPIEKVYNRTQRDKFRWAIEMAGPEYVF